MRLVPMEATTLLLREKRLNPKAFAIQATGVLVCSHIRDPIDGLFLPLCPTTHAHNRPIRFPGKQHLRSLNEGARLAARPQGVETKGLAVPPRRPVATRPAHIRPAGVLSRVWQAGPIKCAIAEYDHLRALWYQSTDQLDQGAMEVFGKVPLRALTYPPRQRQGTTFRAHVEHQGHTPAARHTAIHDEPQGLEGQMPEHEVRIG